MDAVSFRSIKTRVEGQYKEKGSKFIGYAFPCSNEEEFNEELSKIKELHNAARHYCYAYAFGIDGSTYRTNDDGEPSGTAGRPIHGQIRSFELSDVGIVVVRYFGGTKLGASGLIRAYKSAAKEALDMAAMIRVELKEILQIEFDPVDTGKVMRAIEQVDAKILEQHFTDKSGIDLEVKLSKTEAFRQSIDQIPGATIL